MSSEYAYSRPADPAEYGGGGSSGPNYYDPRADFDDDDFAGAIEHARSSRRALRPKKDDDNDDEDERETSLFAEAISFLKQNKGRFFPPDKDNGHDIDEGKMIGAHQALYGSGSGSSGSSGEEGKTHDASSLGMGAALQALKLFTSGEADNSQGHSGRSAKDKLIGLAMAQAGKLWEEQHGSGKVSTDKQSAINAAAEMALKMYLKSRGSGHDGTGGPGGLLSLASKFL
ncbi:hypothetical protein M432DRAFT_66524 [Thermoascus aurantiacus ATCC 26904]